MGRIACCNVLSDLYAMGVTECDNMLMLLGISNKLTAEERTPVVKLMLKGFADCANEAGTRVQGGQTVVNPWMVIGGVATSVCLPSEYLQIDRAKPGHLLVLTKPLGTQVAVNLWLWMRNNSPRWQQLESLVTEADAERGYERATSQMARLNRRAADAMKRFGATACTDVTGFGLLGHARNLAEAQQSCVEFRIRRLPIIANMAAVSSKLNGAFGLLKGTSAETSGGLLIAMPPASVQAFVDAVEAAEPGMRPWIVGEVEAAERRGAVIVDEPEVVEAPSVESEDGRLW